MCFRFFGLIVFLLLRLQLRKQESWHEVTGWLSEEEQGALPGWRNKAAQLIQMPLRTFVTRFKAYDLQRERK